MGPLGRSPLHGEPLNSSCAPQGKGRQLPWLPSQHCGTAGSVDANIVCRWSWTPRCNGSQFTSDLGRRIGYLPLTSMGCGGSSLVTLVILWASSPNAEQAVKPGLAEVPRQEMGPGPSPSSYWLVASSAYSRCTGCPPAGFLATAMVFGT